MKRLIRSETTQEGRLQLFLLFFPCSFGIVIISPSSLLLLLFLLFSLLSQELFLSLSTSLPLLSPSFDFSNEIPIWVLCFDGRELGFLRGALVFVFFGYFCVCEISRVSFKVSIFDDDPF